MVYCPRVVLPLDAVRLAARVRQLDAFLEFVEPVLPHHRATPPRPAPSLGLGGWGEGSVLGEGGARASWAYRTVGRSAGSAGRRISMPVMSPPSISITVACSRSVVKPVSPPYQPMWRHTPSSRE